MLHIGEIGEKYQRSGTQSAVNSALQCTQNVLPNYYIIITKLNVAGICDSGQKFDTNL